MSKQVEGNFRPTIVDENNVRVKDITLKKQELKKDVVSKIDTQMQMKEMYNKLVDIQDMIEYQIKRDRSRDFINPFIYARDLIVNAEDEMDLDKRKEMLLEADKNIAKAIISLSQDYYDTADVLLKNLKHPIKKLFIEKYMKYIVEDMQYVTKYVGVRMQLLDYLGEKNKLKLELEKYNLLFNNFFLEERTKNKMTLADIFHNYFPYRKDNINMWNNLKKEYIANSNSFIDEKDVYILSITDESEDNNEK